MVKAADRNSRAWDMGTSTSSRSFELESWSYIQHKDYQLHLLQKFEKVTVHRPSIPTIEAERLAFFRCYTGAAFKTQMIYLQSYDIARFLWVYVLNVIFNNFAMCYLHLFLAAYSPDEHMFGSKMFPLFIGISWQVVICGITQISSSADVLSVIMHYVLNGFIQKSPWNRCKSRYNPIVPAYGNVRTECVLMKGFKNYTKNAVFTMDYNSRSLKKFSFYSNFYVVLGTRGNYFFQIAPINYFLFERIKLSPLVYKSFEWIAYYAVIWIAASLLYKLLYRKAVWKILRYSHLILNCLYLLVTVIILLKYLEKDRRYESEFVKQSHLDRAVGWDFDWLADSITGPPVLQLLAARSIDRQIEPGRDSTIIVTSNAVLYLFRLFVNYQMENYIEDYFRAPLIPDLYNSYPLFTTWPIFFYTITFGSLLLRIFYILHTIVEFCVFAITYQIIVEVIVCEWKWARRWITSIALCIIGITINTCLPRPHKTYLYVFTTAITHLTEMIVVCWVYPLARLYDDMNFHFGTQPMSFRKWGLRILPLYNLYKLYSMCSTFYHLERDKGNKEVLSVGGSNTTNQWIWTVAAGPLALGIFYSMLKYMVVQKQSWRQLLKPRPDWGPRDHVTRQLRKQFSSKYYVGSQASRYLSRHLLSKAETPSYRLDIRYSDISSAGAASRRSTVFEGLRGKEKTQEHTAT